MYFASPLTGLLPQEKQERLRLRGERRRQLEERAVRAAQTEQLRRENVQQARADAMARGRLAYVETTMAQELDEIIHHQNSRGKLNVTTVEGPVTQSPPALASPDGAAPAIENLHHPRRSPW